MAYIITEDCINCEACEPECPNHAIYEGGTPWTVAEGTEVTDAFKLTDGTEIDAFEEQEALSDELYYIVPEKCTECEGFHDEAQCALVCPVDCCVPDPENEESEDVLLSKYEKLHE